MYAFHIKKDKNVSREIQFPTFRIPSATNIGRLLARANDALVFFYVNISCSFDALQEFGEKTEVKQDVNSDWEEVTTF